MTLEPHSSKLITKVKGVIAILVTVFVGILLIWASYIYKNGQIEIKSYPYIQVISSPKFQNIKKHLLWACTQMKKRNNTVINNAFAMTEIEWLISERFKLLACKVRKVGSTNIARVLYTLDHMSEYVDSNKVKGSTARNKAVLDKKNRTEQSFKLGFKAYKKFMFVRDPMERLLSAYRDHRPHSWFVGTDMSFKDYLEKIVQIPDRHINFHLISYGTMCNPCSVEYKYIGLLDNFERDMGKILRSVGVKDHVVLPKRSQTGYSFNKSDEVLQTYLKDIPKYLLKKVYERYYWDYFLFGFTKPKF